VSAYDAAMPDDAFSDVLAANAAYAGDHASAGLAGRAAKRLAVVTCMDTRIDPLLMLGLRPGDAKILRNGGGRVTDDVLTTLVVARHLLNVDRVMVIAHTDCRMHASSDAVIHEAIAAAGGPDTRSLSFGAVPDQEAAVRADVERVRADPYLDGIEAAGFVLDVETGRLTRVD
jgi:carbonic anhydrase